LQLVFIIAIGKHSRPAIRNAKMAKGKPLHPPVSRIREVAE
jgi:hypothetical protein